MNTHPPLQLKDFSFKELFDPAALLRLDGRFLACLKEESPDLHAQLRLYRADASALTDQVMSQLLIDVAVVLESFLAQLFGIESPLAEKQACALVDRPIFAFKAWYVKKQARRRKNVSALMDFKQLNTWLQYVLTEQRIIPAADQELAVAILGQRLLKNPQIHESDIEKLVQWCAHGLYTPEGQAVVTGWMSFRFPQKLDHAHLVPSEQTFDAGGIEQLGAPEHQLRARDGFALTDTRMSARAVANEVDYCIYCHEQSGDFCSKGFPVKKSDPAQGLRTHPLGELMTGCPLEEKISEMHVLKRDGYLIAPLAVVMVDNPMCPMTGHRICNDCMKACVYQKQTPVNIPEIETRVLTDVLGLPWGVEIYDLLTRWNPLRADQWVVQPYRGKKVLVSGMGPAGLTLAHHLLQAGCAVVGVDGLKIEPLDEALLKQPIYRYQDVIESLDDRLVLGFGGVAEYGITVRWDKNFLKLVYLNLLRRPYFQVFGGMRFGGTITVEDAWEMGFDHLAIAVGAGLPKALPIPGSLALGMRQANDFLMALQLTGAGKASSLANLQVRLPALVIGGGLTGIDTATEVQAYYIQQAEKMLYRYVQLVQRLSESTVRGVFHEDAGELEVLDEWLAHGRAVKAERARALRVGGKPSFHALLSSWGGVRVVYRRSLQESPAYRLNHEEVKAAFEEGIGYIERVEPIAAEVDRYGHVSHLVCQRREQDKVGRWVSTDQTCRLPVRAIFVATGAMPNVAYGFEHAGTLKRQGFQYLTYQVNDQGELTEVRSQQHIKQPDIGMFTSYQQADYRVSLLGDTHPVFHGSVVKAVASAKHAYPQILAQLNPQKPLASEWEDYPQFQSHLSHLLQAVVVSVTRILPQVVKITVSAPMAARQHAPGQFYRLQGFESDAITQDRTLLQSEGVALVGMPAGDGQLDFIVDECGASTRLLALLKPGQRVALMGPTGVRTKIPMTPETMLIMGDHRSIAYMMAVAPAMRLAGHRVIILLVLSRASSLHHQAFLSEHSDAIIYVTDAGKPVETHEDHAASFLGNWQAALLSQADSIQLAQVNRVLIQGSSTLIRQVQAARKHPELMPYFTRVTDWIASVYGPMQCMLKGVCAQCLQWQINPETGKRTKAVFACSWQDQPMDIVDFNNLDERLAQNSVQEKLTDLWLRSLLD